MTYTETIEYLFNSTPVFEKIGAAAYKEGLSNTHLLDAHFGHPHTQFRSIHIAGTNGKGSCSHTLAAILQAEGYRVGLYTSPHIVDFRERIRVNGRMISEEYVVDFVATHRHFFEPLQPSFFELTTAMAFKYFAEEKVDFAIIEVGLGGRLDCTNIIQPLLSIITNISLDHTQFLGDTMAAIAHEKAGIIKPNTPVIIGEATPETRSVFESTAQAQNALITFAEDQPAILHATTTAVGTMHYETRFLGNFEGALGGTYQAKNANTILTAAMHLYNHHVIRKPESIAKGFREVIERTGLLGRWQIIRPSEPRIVCDTGHNDAAWQQLAPQIMAEPCQTLRLVFGMVDDKDLLSVMQRLPQKAVYYWTQPTTKRAFPVERIAALGKQLGLQGTAFPTVKAAYDTALADASPQDFIFIGGSNYVVSDLFSCF